MSKMVILKESSKYAKLINCNSNPPITIYKDKPTEVADDFKLEDSEMKIFGEEETVIKKKSNKKTKRKGE